MKVTEITIIEDGREVNVMTSFTAQELQYLLQFAVNMASSIGLGAEKINRVREAMDEDHELND